MIINKEIVVFKPDRFPEPDPCAPLEFSMSVQFLDEHDNTGECFYSIDSEEWDFFENEPEGKWVWYYPLKWEEVEGA